MDQEPSVGCGAPASERAVSRGTEAETSRLSRRGKMAPADQAKAFAALDSSPITFEGSKGGTVRVRIGS
jgi:hypothetical protein